MPTPARTRPALAAGLLAVSLLAVGCGSDESDDAATTSSTTEAVTAEETTSTTEAPTTTEAAEETTTTSEDLEGVDTETSVLDTLPDGDHYGYLAGLENGTVEGQAVQVIIFDPVEFLTGDAAVAAAQADGVIPADQDAIENDYYIRNPEQTVLRLAVVPEASVTSLDGGSPNPVPSSVDEVWQQDYLFRINVGNVRGITTVSGIEAIYLP
jgi:hypothetical protein